MAHTALKALIFDVDGTLADTEHAHLAAFNQAFAQEGLDWNWSEQLYTLLLEVSGGKERIAHYWKKTRGDIIDVDGSAVRDTINRLHERKTAAYEAMVRGGAIGLRPGVLQLVDQARRAGLSVAIATTTSTVNIAALLRAAIGADWRTHFSAIEDALSAPVKKPHPQVYLQMLRALALPAGACMAFEDSSNGLRAATAAGIGTVITPTQFTVHHDFSLAMRVVDDLAGVGIPDLAAWRADAVTAAQRVPS